MQKKLAQALSYLDIKEIPLYHEDGTIVERISPKAHAIALFSYLDMAGYLHPNNLKKAVTYLSQAKPFSVSDDQVIQHLTQAYHAAHTTGQLDTEYFFDHFFNEYFEVDDIIDLIVFLQQTAFDREFMVERDKLSVPSWLEEHTTSFQHLARNLGIVTPRPPTQNNYCGTGIMGASSVRVKTRLEHFMSLKQECGFVLALSGNREVSKGLDEEEVMIATAKSVGKSVNFVTKGEGKAQRDFLNEVTETMMVEYLVRTMCGNQFSTLDSRVEDGHWRATTAQSAIDVAKILIEKIKNKEVRPDSEGVYHFMIIAEQPYSGRMTKQVQRAFNAEIKKNQLDICIQVEGVGQGVSELDNSGALTRMNSELGSLMAERFHDARLLLPRTMTLRDPNILMFMSRDKTYQALKAQNEHQETPSMSA